MQLVYGDRLFLISTVNFTCLMLYQRYGNYYMEFDGWEVNLNDDVYLINKKRFNFDMNKGECIDFEVKVIDNALAARLIHNELPPASPLSFTEKDYIAIEKELNVRKKLLREKGLL